MKALEKAINSKGKTEYNFIILALLIIAISLLLTACSGNSKISSSTERGTNLNDTIKKVDNNESSMKIDFSLKDTNGGLYKLSSEKGKKIYIKFWATWCPICLGGIDELTKLSEEKAKDGNLEIITIVSPGAKGEMSSSKFIKWFEKQGYKFKVLLDEGGTIAQKFGVRGYPTSVFIDSRGEIAKTQVGHMANNDINTTLLEIS